MGLLCTLKDIWSITAPYQIFLNQMFCFAIAIAAIKAKNNSNVLFIISMLLFPRVVDIILLNKGFLSGKIPNFAFYLLYSIYDACVIGLIIYRTKVIEESLKLKVKVAVFLNIKTKRTVSFTYARHVNEIKIIMILVLSILINLIVAAEYPYRWYIDKEQLLLYYSNSTLKIGLNIALVYWVFKLAYSHSLNR